MRWSLATCIRKRKALNRTAPGGVLEKSVRRSSRGSTLIENVMAMALFAGGMAAGATVMNEVTYTNSLATEIAASTTLARNLFEDFKTRDPEERTRLGIPEKGTTGPVNAAGDPVPSGRYTVDWEYKANIPHEGIDELVITVAWKDARGVSRRAVFHSGVRRGWPVPVIIPDEDGNHDHGRGHKKK